MIQNASMYVTFNKKFQKSFEKAPSKIREAFEGRLSLFIQDQYDCPLHNHRLSGKWKDYSSINITGDWRAVYHWIDEEKVEWVEFVEIGTHSELYG